MATSGNDFLFMANSLPLKAIHAHVMAIEEGIEGSRDLRNHRHSLEIALLCFRFGWEGWG